VQRQEEENNNKWNQKEKKRTPDEFQGSRKRKGKGGGKLGSPGYREQKEYGRVWSREDPKLDANRSEKVQEKETKKNLIGGPTSALRKFRKTRQKKPQFLKRGSPEGKTPEKRAVECWGPPSVLKTRAKRRENDQILRKKNREPPKF